MANEDLNARHRKDQAAWVKNFITVLRAWLSFAAVQPGRSEDVRYILKVIGDLTHFMTDQQLDVLSKMLDEADAQLETKE